MLEQVYIQLVYNHSCCTMTSSHGSIFRVNGPLWGESTGHRWSPSQRPMGQSFDIFFDLRLNKQLSKQLMRRWFGAPSRSLWHHGNMNTFICIPKGRWPYTLVDCRPYYVIASTLVIWTAKGQHLSLNLKWLCVSRHSIMMLLKFADCRQCYFLNRIVWHDYVLHIARQYHCRAFCYI